MPATAPHTVQEDLARRLFDSVERLQRQVEKVEFWATALTGFARPVAEYEPEATAIARYMKPGRPARKKHRRRIARRKTKTGRPASAER